MGLDFSHCDARWGYIGFNRFRHKLAKEMGIENLEEMDGYTPNGKSWDNFKKHPLYKLMIHSDCEGHLTPKQCEVIYPELNKVVSKWPDDDRDKSIALELCKGMRSASKAKENLEFL